MILFSFIIPVYNVEKFLGECLDSVINQTYGNWEAVLINDGSKDNSAKVCDAYAAKDKRIKVWHRENKGSLMARRFGITQAEGDYFLFIDSDDLVDRQLLEKVDRIISNTESDMVVYRFQRFGRLIKGKSPIAYENGTVVGEGGLPKEYIWKKVVSGNSLNSLCTKVVKSSIVDIDTDYQKYAFMKSSTDFMQSMALIDNAAKIYFSDEVLYYYRYNDSGISSTKQKTIDSKSLKLHMKTREVIQDRKLYYLDKSRCRTKENLELLYRFNFITKVDQIIGWISNVKGAGERKAIIKFALDEKALEKGKKYLKPEMFSGKYKKIYCSYIRNDNKMYNVLMLYSNYTKFVSLVSSIVNKLRK